MRLNETKRKQRTSQEEVLAELFAEAELQGSVRKKKNWDAWMEQEEAQQIEKEMQVYLEEYSDPTLYLTLKEVKAWNRMPKSKQKRRCCKKNPGQVLQAWKTGKRKVSAGGGSKVRMIYGKIWSFCSLAGFVWESKDQGHRRTCGIWKPERLPRIPEKSKGNVRSGPGENADGIRKCEHSRTEVGARGGVDVWTPFKNRKTSGCRSAECGIFCCKQRIHGYSSYTGRQNCKENSTNL